MRALQAAVVAASVGYIVLFLVAAALRASYPLQLEWLEGGVLDTVMRVLRGQPVYVRPTRMFVPFLYTPLYYYIGAAACWVGGAGFPALRWLSTLCTVACMVVQFSMASRLANSRLAGVVAAGYFAALYAATGWWFDLARVDMLYVALTMGAVYLSWRHRPLAAAILFVLAFQTKQTGALVAICVLAHEYRNPPRLFRGLGAFFLLGGASVLALMHHYGRWYLYYTRYLPSHQALELRGVFYFFGRDLLYPSSIALLVILFYGVLAFRSAAATPERENFWLPNTRFLLFTSVGLAASCFLGRIHSGASVNIALPLDAWLAVLFGGSVASLLRWAGQGFDASRRGTFVLGAALLQLFVLARPPMRCVPSGAARAEAARELAIIAHTPGDVYSFNNAVDVAVAGKQSFADQGAVLDVLRAGHDVVSDTLDRDVRDAFSQRKYAALLSDVPIDPAGAAQADAPPDLAQFYRLSTAPLVARPLSADPFLADRTHLFPRFLSPIKEP